MGTGRLRKEVRPKGLQSLQAEGMEAGSRNRKAGRDRMRMERMRLAERRKGVKRMTIYINSGGGDVFAGIGIYNILKRHTGHKKGIVDGIAASIASVIMMACDEVVVASGAQVMVHKPLTAAWGNADDFAKVIEQLDKCQQSITNIYMEKAREGVTEEEIAEKINRETWMSGAEAAELFDISVDEKPAAVACIGCMMERYLRKPEGICTESAEEAEARREAAEEEAAIIAEMELCGI